MRISIKISALAVLFSSIVFSCKKNTNPPFIPVGFSVKINNALWTPSNYSANTFSWVAPNGDRQVFLGIRADDGSGGQAFELDISSYSKANSYYAIDGMNIFAYYYDSSFILPYYAGNTGAIRITKVSSNNIQGMFNTSIISPNSANYIITEGQFNVPLN